MIGSFRQIQSTSNAAISRESLLCSQTERTAAGIHEDYGEGRPRHARTLYVVPC